MQTEQQWIALASLSVLVQRYAI